jgi:hypothetical protein
MQQQPGLDIAISIAIVVLVAAGLERLSQKLIQLLYSN